MGRTLWYELHLSRPLSWAEEKEIRAAVAVMNHRCTWTCEELNLRALESERRDEYVRENPGHAPPVLWGMTKVCNDEWNALLIVRFLIWLAGRFEGARIRLHDEGSLVRCSYVTIWNGVLTPDLDAIERQRRWLEENGRAEWATKLVERQRTAPVAGILNDGPAAEFSDRREVLALGISDATMRLFRMSDLAQRLSIPWFGACVDA